jgi:hypothetical protein
MCVEIFGRRISDLRGAARPSPVNPSAQERSEIPPDHLSSCASTPQRGHGEELSLPENSIGTYFGGAEVSSIARTGSCPSRGCAKNAAFSGGNAFVTVMRDDRE